MLRKFSRTKNRVSFPYNQVRVTSVLFLSKNPVTWQVMIIMRRAELGWGRTLNPKPQTPNPKPYNPITQKTLNPEVWGLKGTLGVPCLKMLNAL